MKKYSDKFLNQSNKLKFARVGFEFEFYMKDLSYYKTMELLNQENRELLAVGKLSQPLPSSRTTDMTIYVKIDK